MCLLQEDDDEDDEGGAMTIARAQSAPPTGRTERTAVRVRPKVSWRGREGGTPQ